MRPGHSPEQQLLQGLIMSSPRPPFGKGRARRMVGGQEPSYHASTALTMSRLYILGWACPNPTGAHNGGFYIKETLRA